MKTANRFCGKCGAEFFSDGPQEFCSACLLETGLFANEPVAGSLTKDFGAGDPSVVAAYSAEAAAKAGSTTADDQTQQAARAPKKVTDFGDYELLEKMGGGGQGLVYRARQKSLNRTVALKIIGLGQLATKTHLKRFHVEAEAAASLNHPCIVPIFEIGEREGSCYFSMKFIEGGQLDEVVRREPMSIRRAAELIAKVARTVHYAHEHHILHRDIKPGNILLDAEGEPHLTDFGLARLVEAESSVTRTMEVLGTPSYMAPEQAVGDNAGVTSATDTYGLGAVLYQLLTGHPPFAGGTTYETIKLLLDTEPRQPRLLNPKIDRDLNTICLKCLEKDPTRRYASALALAEDLERWLKHEPIRAHRTGIFIRGRKWLRRNPSIAVMAAMLLVLAVPLGLMIWKAESERSTASNPAPPEKSIAVLPFSNLSKEQENAFFADGVQDEILSDLAKVADLKVISRTSVMPYKSAVARNLRQIGQQLGVAHVVEGSVQRAGNRVRVNAQLVDARTDRHLWAQTYDRDLADVFAIQSEIAKTIADQLQANLSPREKNAIERPPTTEISAFDLYARAKVLFEAPSSGTAEQLQAVDLLNQAVARDPSFFDAYCQLAYIHDALYWFGLDHTSARLALAEAAIQSASRLRPDAGETHLARAQNLYWAYGDYDDALAELEVARQTLPNDARTFDLTGNIQRRQGRWEESTRNFERAVELNPRDVGTLVLGIAWNYSSCRRYAEAKPWCARALAFEPNNAFAKVFLAYVDFDWKADTQPFQQTIDSIRVTNPAEVPGIAHFWIVCALAERDAAAAKDALIGFGEEPVGFAPDNFLFNRPFAEGVIARMTKDDEKARSAFTAARAEQEKIVQAQPNYGPALCALGLIDAGLGRKEEALREGRRAVELLPVKKDSMKGMATAKYLAMIAAWIGDKDLACEQLASIIRSPSSPSYGQLKLLPFWDPLRGDPRFEKLVEEAKQPIALTASASGALSAPNFAPAPEKSIAVLPFENLSRDPDNAFFANGMQDEILTDLSKIADLKVISRTSVMPYKTGIARNLREIGQQLGVAHVVEGSVQRSSNRVRVNAQLIDARTDRHLWGQTYDRDLADVFAIQSEIAKTIADQLRVHLSGREEQEIAAKPTDNPEAYDAYLRGLAYSLKINTAANSLAAQKYLREAVRLDPKFALSWALLSYVDATGYRAALLQPTIALREEARQAAETAVTLQPDLGEALMAKGYYHYSCLRDYDIAVRYFEQARQFLPNSSQIPESLAYVARRRGQWDQSESYFNEAERLDPRNVRLLTEHAGSYMLLRRFPEALRKLDQVLDITPDEVDTLVQKANIAQAEGDLPRAAALLASLHPNADDSSALETQVYQAILERSPAQIIPRLKEILAKPDPALGYTNGELRFWLGWAQEVAGDHAAAQESWRKARGELEPFLKEQPENYSLMGDLALTNMGLGDKAAAFKLIEREMAVRPIEKDALDGAVPVEVLARVAASLEEPDRAIAALQKLLSIPGHGPFTLNMPLTPALLRLDPMFDPLRNDTRFQKLASDASQSPTESALAMPTIPEKSIAVLPFENLSRDPDNAFFADGVQDEILSDLTKIADLKVISRTSVMNYKSGIARNLREIGEQLGVAHVVEGSVQRTGNRVRVNAQLVDARTDRHLWAQTYDRDLADVFAIQSEIAKTIADQLQAKLSPREENAIERHPTSDVSAFDLYVRAKNILLTPGSIEKADTLRVVDLLNQAVARDPSFFDAYCQLAYAHDALYFFGNDHTSARLALAEAALQAASRLRPDAGETHLARGQNLYWAYGDYNGALAELEIARQTLPNDARIFRLTGYIQRRQGRWEESTRDLERAVELNPRDSETLVMGVAVNYWFLRRYAEAKSWSARVLAFEPNDAFTKVWLALVDLDWKADTRPLHQTIDSTRATHPAAVPSIADFWLVCALAERNAAAAKDALIAFGQEPISFALENVRFNRPFAEGVIARMTKDDDKARSAFSAARAEQEKIVQAQPNYGPALCVLGLIDAGLGRKEEALREGRRAVELLPVEKDSMNGTNMIRYLAIIAAWVGDKDLACKQLASIIRRPSNVSYGQLKLLPFWDPLRGDPRFEKLIEESKQPVALK